MLYRHGIFPILKAYGRLRGDDEYAHRLALAGMRVLEHMPGLIALVRLATELVSRAEPSEVFGIRFPASVGLAAGIDKEGIGLPFWEAIGFGFVEVGTVTPRPQQGNPQPRLFRLDEEEMLINRMGFNSGGIEAVCGHVMRDRQRIRMPIGLSLGKNKLTPDDRAAEDYAAVLKTGMPMQPDFVIVNVSSPNTLGLRDLQQRRMIAGLLKRVAEVRDAEIQRRNVTRLPLLVKIAPDLTPPELDDILEGGLDARIDGLVIGNTTVSREMFRHPLDGIHAEAGGASGGDWLFERTLSLAKHAKRQEAALPIIHVGGVTSRAQFERAREVSDLVEICTGFVFDGPVLVRRCRRVRPVRARYCTRTTG